MVNRSGGVRQITHDPATGVAFPCHTSYVKPVKGQRATARYRLKVPDALCDEWGIKSRCLTYTSLQALLDSGLYKRVVAEETRLNHSGTKRIKRTAACREASVKEYEQLIRDGLQLPPQIRFRPESAVWAVTRTFGTGWTFRATALTYNDARRLHDECAKVRSVDEVIGNCQPTPKGTKRPFSRRILARADAESAAEKEAVDVVMAEEAERSDDEDAVEFSGEVDRIYTDAPSVLTIDDEALGRRFRVAKTSTFPDAVVWNPALTDKTRGMSDFGDEEYREMVCVEVAGVKDKITVEPGETWEASQTISYSAI